MWLSRIKCNDRLCIINTQNMPTVSAAGPAIDWGINFLINVA